MDDPGCLFGYRSMLHSLRMGHGLTAPRDLVQRLMKEIDPDGCELQKRRRSDCGTENGNIAAAQCYFRVDATDEYAGEKAHRYGESKRNQQCHDSEDQKQPVNAEKLNEVRQHVADPVNQDNQDVQEYLNYVCTSEGLEKPTD
ncbi:Hypothetical predicted protein [Paramuricea clavata]|uniref:Uncharacterized protein n=1 Tax=Paramuricea clavata TaxID=317549 RepID=A0A6S7J5D7_PARCT|nr:Hypothetical predicted protein [Paramuricea clavata]